MTAAINSGNYYRLYMRASKILGTRDPSAYRDVKQTDLRIVLLWLHVPQCIMFKLLDFSQYDFNKMFIVFRSLRYYYHQLLGIIVSIICKFVHSIRILMKIRKLSFTCKLSFLCISTKNLSIQSYTETSTIKGSFVSLRTFVFF